mmetsp:Transcript_38250/g.58317  ORF Transcript_38250/g.58317 Transcript_38250/m.58317 type:complete len:94 (+) Transcript_38250:2689-2970(+)
MSVGADLPPEKKNESLLPTREEVKKSTLEQADQKLSDFIYDFHNSLLPSMKKKKDKEMTAKQLSGIQAVKKKFEERKMQLAQQQVKKLELKAF